ncbi:MAG TPA: tRNA preQ1(34) S-adenosylmethionine ribosyltransferase-isomerase QueA [Stellaceae bacterium]|nr:tRNA preQ1(34) S-adenosylmethionine ribosyltransferase-isomerase QueA [Stellaceae bacterium]
MRLADFDFDLPRGLIADRPAEPRDAARLLVVSAAADFADRRIGDLPDLLRPGDLLVGNDTKVIPARLVGQRGAATVEITLAHQTNKTFSPIPAAQAGGQGDSSSFALGSRLRGNDDNIWTSYAKGARRLHPGDRIVFAEDFAADVVEKDAEGAVILRFDLEGAAFFAALARHGAMPLPPYIKRLRGGDPADREHYQTVFAREPGAVAAPTAGLHFTPALLERLSARGIELATLTLHVGPGTFLPVKSDDPREHKMHGEWGVISAETTERIRAVKARGGRIIAIGTTSLRLLESAAAETGEVGALAGETRLFILPGYRIKAADLLLTNFHLPRSTLFMLVAALAGLDRMKAAYAHAIAARYRFFSYGDACLIEPRR